MKKPRLIYLSDEMWAMVKRHAIQHDLSPSMWLQALVVMDAYEEQERNRVQPPKDFGQQGWAQGLPRSLKHLEDNFR